MAASIAQWLDLPTKGGAGAAFARKYGLSSDTLCMLCDMRLQFATMLADMGMIRAPTNGRSGEWLNDPSAHFNRHADKAFVVRSQSFA